MIYLKEYNTEYDDHKVNQGVNINNMKPTIDLPTDYFIKPDEDGDDDDEYYSTSAGRDGLYHGTEPGHNKGIKAKNTSVYKMSAESKILTYKQFESYSLPDFSDITGLSKRGIMKYLSMGVDINVRCYHNETFLFFAVQKNNIELVKYLLDNGADPNLLNEYEFPPIYYAAIRSLLDIVDILIRYGSTCFMNSSNAINTDIIKYLDDTLELFKKDYPESYNKYIKEKKTKLFNL
jgi:hypothetical protein